MSRRTRSGFTLIEILMVVAVLGIVGVTAVAYVGGRDDLKVASAARRLVSGLQFAQNLAIARRVPHYVVDKNDWIAVYTRDGATWVPVEHPAGGGLIGVDISGKEGVTRHDSTFDGLPVLGFDATGQPFKAGITGSPQNPLADQADCELKSGNHIVRVMVEPVTGEVTIKVVNP